MDIGFQKSTQGNRYTWVFVTVHLVRLKGSISYILILDQCTELLSFKDIWFTLHYSEEEQIFIVYIFKLNHPYSFRHDIERKFSIASDTTGNTFPIKIGIFSAVLERNVQENWLCKYRLSLTCELESYVWFLRSRSSRF